MPCPHQFRNKRVCNAESSTDPAIYPFCQRWHQDLAKKNEYGAKLQAELKKIPRPRLSEQEKRDHKNKWRRTGYKRKRDAIKAAARAARQAEEIPRQQRKAQRAMEREAKRLARQPKVPANIQAFNQAFNEGRNWVIAQLQVLCPSCKSKLPFNLQ